MFNTIFISDLHLTREHSAKNQVFINACEYFAQNTKTLYILGDFWDAWLGDDSLIQPQWQSGYGAVSQALKILAEKIEVYFMVGNRDFILSDDFFRLHNLIKITDPYLLKLEEQNILLTHGDFYCLEDKRHLESAKIIRAPQFINDFLAKPMAERMEMLGGYSREEVGKNIDIDKNHTVSQLQQYNATLLIHGHIHQPQFQLISQTVSGRKYYRWVLHNWDSQPGMLGFYQKSFKLYDLDFSENKINLSEFKNDNE